MFCRGFDGGNKRPLLFPEGFCIAFSRSFRLPDINNSPNLAITTAHTARSRRATASLRHVLITAVTSLAITTAHTARSRRAASAFGHVLIVVTSLAITTAHTARSRRAASLFRHHLPGISGGCKTNHSSRCNNSNGGGSSN